MANVKEKSSQEPPEDKHDYISQVESWDSKRDYGAKAVKQEDTITKTIEKEPQGYQQTIDDFSVEAGGKLPDEPPMQPPVNIKPMSTPSMEDAMDSVQTTQASMQGFSSSIPSPPPAGTPTDIPPSAPAPVAPTDIPPSAPAPVAPTDIPPSGPAPVAPTDIPPSAPAPVAPPPAPPPVVLPTPPPAPPPTAAQAAASTINPATAAVAKRAVAGGVALGGIAAGVTSAAASEAAKIAADILQSPQGSFHQYQPGSESGSGGGGSGGNAVSLPTIMGALNKLAGIKSRM